MEAKLVSLGVELLIFLAIYGAIVLLARYSLKKRRVNGPGHFAHTGFCPGHELSEEDEETIHREIKRDMKRQPHVRY